MSEPGGTAREGTGSDGTEPATRAELAVVRAISEQARELAAAADREVSGMRNAVAGIVRAQNALRTTQVEQGRVIGRIAEAVGLLVVGQQELRAEIRAELDTRISGLRSELRDEISELRTELRGEISGLRGEVSELRADVTAVRGGVVEILRRLEAG